LAEENNTESVRKLEPGFAHEDEDGSLIIRENDIKRLRIEPADVIILKQRGELSVDMVDQLSEFLGARGHTDTLLIVVRKLSDIRTLNEEQMAKHGWYRGPKVKVHEPE
jgi:hypothetical protein